MFDGSDTNATTKLHLRLTIVGYTENLTQRSERGE